MFNKLKVVSLLSVTLLSASVNADGFVSPWEKDWCNPPTKAGWVYFESDKIFYSDTDPSVLVSSSCGTCSLSIYYKDNFFVDEYKFLFDDTSDKSSIINFNNEKRQVIAKGEFNELRKGISDLMIKEIKGGRSFKLNDCEFNHKTMSEALKEARNIWEQFQ